MIKINVPTFAVSILISSICWIALIVITDCLVLGRVECAGTTVQWACYKNTVNNVSTLWVKKHATPVLGINLANGDQFLSRVTTAMLKCDTAILSVRPSSCHALVLYQSGLTYHHTFFSPFILVVPVLNTFAKFRRSPPMGAFNKGWVYKFRDFRPTINVQNATR